MTRRAASDCCVHCLSASRLLSTPCPTFDPACVVSSPRFDWPPPPHTLLCPGPHFRLGHWQGRKVRATDKGPEINSTILRSQRSDPTRTPTFSSLSLVVRTPKTKPSTCKGRKREGGRREGEGEGEREGGKKERKRRSERVHQPLSRAYCFCLRLRMRDRDVMAAATAAASWRVGKRR